MANDPKVVATTNAWKDQSVNDKGYREGVDYSLAIKNATSDAEIKQLQSEREAKINDVYGGKDPYTTTTTNKNTGATTTPTNTASKYYGSDWTPQTATKESNLNYNAQQAVQGGQSYGDFLNSISVNTNLAERDAALAWAKAGGSVPYTSGPNAGKDAWSLSPTGYNTNLDSVLGDVGAMEEKLKKEGYIKDGKIVDWEAVNELLNQSALKAQYEGGVFDKIAAANYFTSQYAGAGGPGATQTQTPNGAGVQNAIGPNGSGSGSSSNTNININGGNGGNYTGAAPSLYDYLEQWMQNATKQQQNAIDWATSQQIRETLRAQQEADAQFQNTRDQIAIDEAKAKDNQALYAETRGDKGGIGASQYDAIMNTAAQNRLSVNQAQTKMASDTAQTIANLRAQGEYEKADALLELSQTYLAQLISLEQWSAEYGLSVAQFQAQLDQWKKDYELNLAQVMGSYNGAPTLENQKYQDSLALNQQETLADQGWKALSLGVTPSPSQLKAMGVTADQVNTYLTSQKLKEANKTSPSTDPAEMDMEGLFEAASKNGGYSWLKQKSVYKQYGFDSAPTQADYDKWVEENVYTDDDISGMARAIATDIKKYHGSSDQDMLDQIDKAFDAGTITQKEYRWLCDQLGV